MTAEAYGVIAILAGAILSFSFEWIAPELTAVLALISLLISGVLTPQEAFAGFGNSSVIAIGALLVIGAGLTRSGAVKWLADRLGAFAGTRHGRLLLVSTAIPGVLSGFINIVASVTIFIPAVLRMARRGGLEPSRFLLPMALSSLMGANLSLIGAAHNLVVNSQLQQQTGESFGFFEFTPIGAILLLFICLYAQIFSKRMLAKSSPAVEPLRASVHRLVKQYRLEDRIWEIQVQPDSSIDQKSLNEIGIGRKYGLSIFTVLRGDEQLPVESKRFVVQAGDVLALGGRFESIQALVHEQNGLTLMGQPVVEEEFTWSAFDMLEVVVPPRSAMVGCTLREKRIRHSTGLTAVGLWRADRPMRTGIHDHRLQAGDAILFFGSRTRVRDFHPEPDFVWLNRPRRQEAPLHLRKFAPAAALIFLAVVVSAALGRLPIAAAAMAGAAAMILIGLLDTREAYRRIDWRTLILIAGMYPVGTALTKTGAAMGIAELILQSAGSWGTIPALLATALLAMILTQPMHSAVSALMIMPIALQVAAELNSNPKAFAVSVIIASSASFLMPVGHPAPLLVREPGDYRNRDYLKFGILPALLVLAVIAVLVPMMWPLGQ